MRMKYLPETKACRAKWAQDEPQLPLPAALKAVERVYDSTPANPFCKAQDILRRNPLATFAGSITDDIYPACSFLVNCDSMQCKSSTSFIQYDASKVECAIHQRFNGNDLSISNGWIHARTQSLKTHRGIGAQKRFDDITNIWCRR